MTAPGAPPGIAWPWWGVAAWCLASVVACFDPIRVAPCQDDLECADGRCEQGECVAGEADAVGPGAGGAPGGEADRGAGRPADSGAGGVDAAPSDASAPAAGDVDGGGCGDAELGCEGACCHLLACVTQPPLCPRLDDADRAALAGTCLQVCTQRPRVGFALQTAEPCAALVPHVAEAWTELDAACGADEARRGDTCRTAGGGCDDACCWLVACATSDAFCPGLSAGDAGALATDCATACAGSPDLPDLVAAHDTCGQTIDLMTTVWPAFGPACDAGR